MAVALTPSDSSSPSPSPGAASSTSNPAPNTNKSSHFLASLFRVPSEKEKAYREYEVTSYQSGDEERQAVPRSTELQRSASNPSSKPSWLSRKASSKKAANASKSKLAGIVTSKREIVGAVKDDWPMYSANPEDYEMGEPIGYGATSVVRLATFKPINQVVAVKVMEFEGKDSIAMMQREVKLMSLSKHPNILRVRGDWVAGAQLCIATRFIPPGSLLDIMEYAHRDGLDETTCATILKQACEGTGYLHVNGWLHRDIKAGNLLIDDDGTVLISDFGCSSQVSDANGMALLGNAARTRKSFVGTPCWMAPEVVEQKPYNGKADIWSFGITAIEIATGQAPHALYTPAQILLKTVAENSPTLDIDGQAHPFSLTFKSMIDSCLRKDPSKRPTADDLLSHAFFKEAKRKQHLIGALLAGLPPLQSRQTRRSKHSLRLSSRINNTSVWDFETSPLSDQFAGFTMNGAMSPSNVGTPIRSRFPSMIAEENSGLERSPGRSRRREGSMASVASVSSGHKRGISFIPVSESTEETEPSKDPVHSEQ